MIKMKQILFFGLAALHLNAYAQPSKRQPVEGIVAQIGDNVILKSDLMNQRQQAIQSGVEITADFECGLLEDLMYQNLLINQAKLDSVEITDANVDFEMENRLRALEEQIGSREKLEAFYGKSSSQIKMEFRESIRQRMIAQEMERKITEDVTITPREVKLFYDGLPKDSIPFINAQFTFQQIVQYPEITRDDRAKAKSDLEALLKQVRAGKSMTTLARLNSDDTGSASKGGEIKARVGMMVPAFESTVMSLKEGEISEVFETEYGYHFVKLIERKGESYTCQHILKIPTYTDASLAKAAQKMDSCYALLKEGKITWTDAVLRFSNDEATRYNNGVMSNPYTGDQKWDAAQLNELDQQIYYLTNKLKINEFTEPNLYVNYMDRKEGVRIVKVMNRTQPHTANMKEDYSLIQSAAENDKHRTILDKWVGSKIKYAYVRIAEPYNTCTFKNQWLD